jgi:ribosomal protein S18 acetylase RimI-like enzyme
MIRSITQPDTAAVVALTVSSELFTAEESTVVETMLTDYFAGRDTEGHTCLVDEVDGDLLAVAYYEPVTATDRTWELTMIGVRQDVHRRGRGAALLRHVEHDLRSRDQRLLVIETSALPAFARARAFYLALGYDEEARVRDYFQAGDDMVLFRKAVRS